ncbi:MAG TPA: hypothetical protein VFQ61_06395 [Polyangiaceae bacterium]|nr:hypothetical protein [Polyangiaceae bacterium]
MSLKRKVLRNAQEQHTAAREKYEADTAKFVAAMKAWLLMPENAGKKPEFRLPPRGVEFFGALNPDLLALNEDARDLLSYVDRETDHQATLNMAIGVIESITGQERPELDQEAEKLVELYARMLLSCEFGGKDKSVCPHCRTVFDARAALVGEDPDVRPIEGSYNVCGSCGELSLFDAAGDLRRLTADEWASVPDGVSEMARLVKTRVARNRSQDQ